MRHIHKFNMIFFWIMTTWNILSLKGLLYITAFKMGYYTNSAYISNLQTLHIQVYSVNSNKYMKLHNYEKINISNNRNDKIKPFCFLYIQVYISGAKCFYSKKSIAIYHNKTTRYKHICKHVEFQIWWNVFLLNLVVKC